MLCIYVLAQSARRESLYFYYLPLWAFSAWEAPLILPCTYLLPISHLLTFVWSNLIMFIILIMLNNLTMLTTLTTFITLIICINSTLLMLSFLI